MKWGDFVKILAFLTLLSLSHCSGKIFSTLFESFSSGEDSTIIEPDVVNPTVTKAIAVAYNKVRITLSESIIASSAECNGITQCNGTIYTIAGLTVSASVAYPTTGTSSTQFTLTTTEQTEANSYTLTITADTLQSVLTSLKITSSNNTAIFSGDGIPTVLINATGCSGAVNNQVIFNWDQLMKTGSTTVSDNVDTIGNYKVIACSGGACSGSSQTATATTWDSSTKKATVTFATAMTTGVSLYTFEISNIRDVNGNKMITPTTKTANCGPDVSPPTFDSAVLNIQNVSETQVLLTFSEEVDQTTAESTGNYKYDSQSFGASIISATRQTAINKVLLIIQPALVKGGHSITVQNVKDAYNNTIAGTPQQPFTITPSQSFSEGPVFDDPFSDGAQAGQIFIFNNKLSIGGDTNHSKIFEFSYDMSTSLSATLDADGTIGAPFTSFLNFVSVGSGTIPGIDAFNRGCVGGSSIPSLTGTACSGASGTEYTFIGGYNTTGSYQSFWYSSDTGATRTFTEVAGLASTGNTYRSMTAFVFRQYLYIASPHRGGSAPRVSRICLVAGGCSNGQAQWNVVNIEGIFFPMIGKGGAIPNSTSDSSPLGNTVAIDTMWEYDNDGTGGNASQLYIANGGRFVGVALGVSRDATSRADGGILRSRTAYSTSASPPGCEAPNNTSINCNTVIWENITPTNTKWLNYMSNALPYLPTASKDWANLLPSNRITPAIKAIPYMRTAPNGDLYIIRNACSTQLMQTFSAAGTDISAPGGYTNENFTSQGRQTCPPGNEIPQLWMLPKGTTGSPKGAADWLLVAARATTDRTDMGGNISSCGSSPNKCLENTHITLLEFNGSYLYIGFDNADYDAGGADTGYGANIWRTDMSSVSSGSTPAESVFSLVANFGLDASSGAGNGRIFSHLTVNDAGTDYIVIVTRDGSNAAKIYRTSNSN